MKADVNGEVDFNEESLGRFLTARLGADCGTYHCSAEVSQILPIS